MASHSRRYRLAQAVLAALAASVPDGLHPRIGQLWCLRHNHWHASSDDDARVTDRHCLDRRRQHVLHSLPDPASPDPNTNLPSGWEVWDRAAPTPTTT